MWGSSLGGSLNGSVSRHYAPECSVGPRVVASQPAQCLERGVDTRLLPVPLGLARTIVRPRDEPDEDEPDRQCCRRHHEHADDETTGRKRTLQGYPWSGPESSLMR